MAGNLNRMELDVVLPGSGTGLIENLALGWDGGSGGFG